MSLKTRNGFYHYEFQVAGTPLRRTTGIRNDGTKKAERAAQAKELADRLAAEQASAEGVDLGARPLTLHKAIEDYWDEAGHKLKDRNTRRHLDLAQEFFGSAKLFVDLTTNDVSKLIAWRRKQPKHGTDNEPLSNSSINRLVATLRGVYSRARDVWEIDMPRKAVRWAVDKKDRREAGHRVRVLSPEEFHALKAAIDRDYWKFLQFALKSGLRKAENVLTWPQIDLTTGRMKKLGKGGALVRKPLPAAALELIKSCIGDHPEYVFTYVADRTVTRRVKGVPRTWVKGRRYPITMRGLDSYWFRARAQAAEDCPSLLGQDGGLTMRWHDLRHTFASDVLAATKDLKTLQELMGHADISTTMRYAHLLDGALRDGIEAGAKSQDERLGIAK